MINRLVPRTNLISWKSLHISTAKHKKHLYANDSQICRPAQKAKDTYPFGAMCVVQKLHQQAEDLVAWTWMPPRTQKSLIST